MKITFLGATGTVTGSRFLIEANDQRILIDAGMYQGLKELRLRNWQSFPFEPATINAVVLTHAHIDHCGYLPRLVSLGFSGQVHCTSGTAHLAPILLRDAAHLQEEEAKFANKHGYSKHEPAEPLYTTADAEDTIKALRAHKYQQWIELGHGIKAYFKRAGHILGSAHLIVKAEGRTVAFSGDVGREVAPVMPEPSTLPEVDLLVMESTYGDRRHPDVDPKAELARIVNEARKRGGALIIPAFAVGRTQEILYTLRELEEENRIPVQPTFLDSPMAQKVTHLYPQHPEDMDKEMLAAMRTHKDALATGNLVYTRSSMDSKALNNQKGSFILISASGMMTGGRIVHHLRARLADPATTILVVGFQAAGTRGRALLDGATSLKMFGTKVAVRAHIETIHGFSAHADQRELTNWVHHVGAGGPRRIALVHGEERSLKGLKAHLLQDGFRDIVVPAYKEEISV